MGVRMRVLVYALDLSSSMDNPDYDGVVKRKKVFNALKDLEKWLESLSDDRDAGLLDRFEYTYMALAYFGEAGFDPSKDYLFDLAGRGKLVRLADLRDALSQGASLVEEDAFNSVGHDGTDVGQLLRAVESVVSIVENEASKQEADDVAYYLVVMGDGCFNLYEGSPLSPNDVYDVMAEAGNRLSNLLTKPRGARLRGKIFLLWGDPSGFEDDAYICPWRACLIASRMNDLPPAIASKLRELEKQGIITRKDDFFDDPNRKVPKVPGDLLIRDFAVARINSLDKLSQALISITTTAAGQR